MNKLHCIAIEDEPQALQLLEHHARQVPFIFWEGGFRQPLEALPLLNQGKIDLLFLDINLTTIDGISFYKSLIIKPKVIFTTAYAHHAAESYFLEAVDYLLKPIEFQRFLQACNKAIRAFTSGEYVQKEIPSKEESVYIKSGTRWHHLYWADVCYLEKDENYVVFHLSDSKKILSRQNMADVERTVPVYFSRIHKSYIVNTRKINIIEREKVFVNGVALNLADSYRESFMNQLGLRLGQ